MKRNNSLKEKRVRRGENYQGKKQHAYVTRRVEDAAQVCRLHLLDTLFRDTFHRSARGHLKALYCVVGLLCCRWNLSCASHIEILL